MLRVWGSLFREKGAEWPKKAIKVTSSAPRYYTQLGTLAKVMIFAVSWELNARERKKYS